MRGTGQISGDWSLDDIKTAAAEVLAADRASRDGEQVVDPAVFDISRMPASLKRYWLTGAGAAKIRWGEGGDFMRCVNAINAEITKHGRAPLPDHEIKGLCANLHREATGATPGNAPGEAHHAVDGDPTARMAELIAALPEALNPEFGWKVRQAGKFWHHDGTPAMPGEEGAGLLMHNPLTKAKKSTGTPARAKAIPTFDEFQKALKDEQAKKDAKNGIKGAGLYDTTGRPKEVDPDPASVGRSDDEIEKTRKSIEYDNRGYKRVAAVGGDAEVRYLQERLAQLVEDQKRDRTTNHRGQIVQSAANYPRMIRDVKQRLQDLKTLKKTGGLTAAVDPTARMADLIAEFTERRVRNAEYWGLPVGTPIKPGMKPAGRKTPGKPKSQAADHPPGWGDPDPAKFAAYIRKKYKLPDASDDNAIRSDLPAGKRRAVKASAAAKAQAAADAEPAIRKAVTTSVATHGGTLDREDTSLKSVDSMERKIADGVVERGLSPDEAAASIRDSVRFTAVVPTRGYWAAGTRIGDDLEAAGYRRVKQSRGWDLESMYAGRNDTFAGPDGVEFEVQFHTAESLAATQRNHDLYNMSRRADTPPAARAELQAEQKAYTRAHVPLPDDLPTRK